MVQRLVHAGLKRLRDCKKSFLAFVSRVYPRRPHKNQGAQEQRDAIQPVHVRSDDSTVQVKQGGGVPMDFQKTKMINHLIIQLPNGQFLKVDVPPEVLMGGGKPPTPPIPPVGGGDDFFGGMPEMPEPSKKDVVEAIMLLCIKYRHHHKIPDWTAFNHAQIAEIVDSVRHMIYQHEGIMPPK